MSRWYEHIELEPYTGSDGSEILVLVESLGMNVRFDDVDSSTCRFCFKLDAGSPIVDYEISWDDLDAWFNGESPLVLDSIEHDASKFGDLVFMDASR